MPFGFGRKSASPDVIRMRGGDSKSGKKIPSLTEQINKNTKTLHHLSWDVLPTDVEIASHPPSSRYSLDSNNGPSFTTFRSGVSVSSPNLSESPYPSKNRNFIQRQSEQTGGPNVCPTCSIPFNDQNDCRVPRILPCLHTLCTGCLQRAENFLVFLSKSQNRGTRYSWRRRSARTLLGYFFCPFCHGMTSIFLSDGVRAFPVNRFMTSSTLGYESNPAICNRQSHVSLLQMVVRELYPRIKTVQRAIRETERSRQDLVESVDRVERKISPLLHWHQERTGSSGSPSPPPSPNSSSVVVGQVRDNLFLNLRALKVKRMNQIIRQLLLLRQCEEDMQFLCNFVSQMAPHVGAGSDVITTETVHNVASRLSELGNTLDGVGYSLSSGESDSSLDSDDIVSEIISELTGVTRPFKCYGDVKTPLYEKVVCEIPILVLDKENRPASDDDLTRISGGLLLKQDLFCRGTVKRSNTMGVVILEVVPSGSGLAELDVRFDQQMMEVRPSSVLVRPLVLESEFHPVPFTTMRRVSRDSRDSTKTISI